MNENRMTDNYKPGDVANGHILGDDNQWHPLPAPDPATRVDEGGMSTRKKWLIGGGIALAVIIVGGALSGPVEDGPEPAAAPESAEESAPEPEPEPEEQSPGIGDPVRDGKFEFVVTEVRSGLPSVGDSDSFYYEEAQGAYTVVSMTVANIGDEAQMFTYSNQYGIDSQGRELEADSIASWSVNDAVGGWLEDINPGNSISVNVVFDVAPGESITAVELHDSAFSGGTTVRLGSEQR